MNGKQKKTLNFIGNLVPKKLGVKNAYFRIPNAHSIEFLFILDKENASSSMSYIRSLSTIVSKELNDSIDIHINFFIYEKKKQSKYDALIEDERYTQAKLAPNLAKLQMSFA